MSSDLISHINSFTSMHCDMGGLSWATFEVIPNEKTKLTNWDRKKLPETKLNLYQLSAFMLNVLKDVPKSDFYVFENPNAPVSMAKINLNIQLTQMIGMASVIVAQNNTLPIPLAEGFMNIVYLRKFLFAR